MSPYLFLAVFVTFVIVWWGERWILRLSLKYNLVDRPNERSLHNYPIPRTGGIGVILAIAIGWAFYNLFEVCRLPWELGTGAILLIGVSILEDYDRVPIKIRLPVQVLAAGLVVFNVELFQNFPLPKPLNFELGIMALPLNFLWILGTTNIFNFMDGIDGFAAMQGMLAGIFFAILSNAILPIILGLLVASACLAFLRWNWHPARLFFGETGAITLGFVFATFPFYFPDLEPASGIFMAGLFFWFFLADGTFTLIRRTLRGERIWEPHRSHLYQRLVLTGWNHAQIGLGIMTAQALIAGFTLFCWYWRIALWYPLLAALFLFMVYWKITRRREKAL